MHGDHHEVGLKLGEISKLSIRYRLRKLHISDNRVKANRRSLETVDSLCRNIYPDYIDELIGFSEGSGTDYWKILMLNCPEMHSAREGCSSIAVTGGKSTLFHNEDGASWERKNDFFIANVTQGERSYSSFIYPGELPGTAYNWNSEGLFFTVDYVVPIRREIEKPSRYFTSRALLEARSLNEATRILKKNPEASGSHYYIGKGRTIISAETANGKVDIKKITGRDYHTNHYIHKKFRGKSKTWKNSEIRSTRINELLGQGKNPIEILSDKKNKPDSIFGSANCTLRTLSTVVFSPLEKRVLVYDDKRCYRRWWR